MPVPAITLSPDPLHEGDTMTVHMPGGGRVKIKYRPSGELELEIPPSGSATTPIPLGSTSVSVTDKAGVATGASDVIFP